MLVPSSKLLLWTGIVTVAFGLMGAVAPATIPLGIAAMLGMLSILAYDAVFGSKVVEGIELKAPEVLRVSRSRSGTLAMKLRNSADEPRRLRLALEWPSEVTSLREESRITLAPRADWHEVEWPFVASQRGRYQLGKLHVEGSSRLGFWHIRNSLPAATEVRVYPNLVAERKSLAALFLNRGTFGMHTQRQVGKGREFEKLREYLPGDSIDDVHWKASAKRGHPVTKVYQIERTQEVYVIIDASRLSARRVPGANQKDVGSTGPNTDSVLERFINAALVLGLVAEQQGDLFGLITCSDHVDSFIRARNGKEHYSTCRDALYTLEPRIVSPDFEELATFIRLRLRRRALLILLTALDDVVIAESFVRNIDLFCRQHLAFVNMLQPAGVKPLFSDPGLTSVNELYDHLSGHLRWQNLRELEKVLRRRGVRFNLLANEKLTAQLVSQYLEVKQRQML